MAKHLIMAITFAALCFSSRLQGAEQAQTAITTQKIIGTALYKENLFFYTEEDTFSIKENHILKIDSLYKDKDSKLIVEMHSDFSKKPYFPEISFEDHRKKTQFKIILTDDQKFVSVSQNFADPKIMKTKKLDYLNNMTNSMGLINYIRENFQKAKTESKSFRYVIPALMDDYGMILEYRPNKESTDLTVRFAFKIQSFFIRNLSGIREAVLSFDSSGRFIKAFSGASNILDESNHAVDVQIVFTEPVLVKTK